MSRGQAAIRDAFIYQYDVDMTPFDKCYEKNMSLPPFLPSRPTLTRQLPPHLTRQLPTQSHKHARAHPPSAPLEVSFLPHSPNAFE